MIRDNLSLKNDEVLFFLGDSITANGILPGGYVTLVKEALNKYLPGVVIRGAGVSGDRVADCLNRLSGDVLDFSPTTVVIVVGINDAWKWEEGEGTNEEDFRYGIDLLVLRILEKKARVVLCTPGVIGEKRAGSNPFDPELDAYAEICRRVALKYGCFLLDLRKAFLAYLEKNNPDNLSQGVLTMDSVHLNPRGNRFLANLVLEMFGFERCPAPDAFQTEHS